jgi:hypothetical protein
MSLGFERNYVDLLVALWLELDRLDAPYGAAGAAVDRARIELGAEIVLLELALLEVASDRWRGARLVTAAERQQLREPVAVLHLLVAGIVAAPDEATAAMLARAQNRLLDEIRARAVPLASQAPRAG